MKKESAPYRQFALIAGLGLLLSLSAAGTVVGASKPPTLDDAKWVWHKGAGQGAGTWYFQHGFDFQKRRIVMANIS